MTREQITRSEALLRRSEEARATAEELRDHATHSVWASRNGHWSDADKAAMQKPVGWSDQ